MQPTAEQLKVLAAEGHLLVTGGPGSGKTTISILKAAKFAGEKLRQEQHVLFLSFARSTVSRVVEAIEYEQKIDPDCKRRIEVETYHSFFWRLLRAHGYLLGLPRPLTILTPPAAAIALSDVRDQFGPSAKLTQEKKAQKVAAEKALLLKLATENGRIAFSLFAQMVGDLLHASDRLRQLVAARYPLIIFDEFQDTDEDQWRVVIALGAHCTLFSLADPEQRIYDWLGANPARLDQFKAKFDPTFVGLGTSNHRSPGTDITAFANDVLAGSLRQEKYAGIDIKLYGEGAGPAMTDLVAAVYDRRQKLVKSGVKAWALAILVPTRKMTRVVSDALREPPAEMKAVFHTAVIEMEAAVLAAHVVAYLLQPGGRDVHFGKFIGLMRDYYQGRGGNDPTKTDLEEARRVVAANAERIQREKVGKPIRGNSLLVSMLEVYEETRRLPLSGDPDKDWTGLRSILEGGACGRLRDIARDVRDVRLLDRGTQLRQGLAQSWRDNGSYLDALEITQLAFVQEHFASSARPETGVVVMNMHKAKGKQFDEVIIFEGWPRRVKSKVVANPDRIVWDNAAENCSDQNKQNFRVSITRGKRFVTILTPGIDPCILLRHAFAHRKK
jgi:DNA helicase II / ATP-dependent DNA helicase PcrA